LENYTEDKQEELRVRLRNAIMEKQNLARHSKTPPKRPPFGTQAEARP